MAPVLVVEMPPLELVDGESLLLHGRPEQVAVGSGLGVAELHDLAATMLPGVELVFHDGGQPLYPILAGAE